MTHMMDQIWCGEYSIKNKKERQRLDPSLDPQKVLYDETTT